MKLFILFLLTVFADATICQTPKTKPTGKTTKSSTLKSTEPLPDLEEIEKVLDDLSGIADEKKIEWRYIGAKYLEATSNGKEASLVSLYYYNTARVRRNPDKSLSVWIKQLWTVPANIPQSEKEAAKIYSQIENEQKGGNEFGYMLQNFQIDCLGERLKVLNTLSYAKNGTVLNTVKGSDAYSPVVPESVGDEVFKRICKFNNKW